MNFNLRQNWTELETNLLQASKYVDSEKLINFNLFLENNEFELALDELFENSKGLNSLIFWNLLLMLAKSMQLKKHEILIENILNELR